MHTIWLARHGNRADFIDPTWRDNAERPHDCPLSEDGFQQARETGEFLKGKGIELIISSPFLRTVQTAHTIADILDLAVIIEPGICEWLNPEWFDTAPEWLPIEELKKEYPRIDATYTPITTTSYPEPNEEDMKTRTEKAITTLATGFKQDFLAVGHGASVGGMKSGLCGCKLDIFAPLASLSKLAKTGESWTLEIDSDNSHLKVTEDNIRLH